MKPYYEYAGITIYHGDCREILPGLGRADLLLSDPPWGVSTRAGTGRFSPSLAARAARRGARSKRGVWWSNGDRSLQRHSEATIVGDDEPFDPKHLMGSASRTILWGGHCFADRLPPSAGWLVWDKREGIEDCEWPMSAAELAWTNVCGGVHVFRHRWMGLVRKTEQGQHLHPTQKPVALMAWCIGRWGGDLIIDPYMGSGPVLRAAKDLGRKAIGIEIEEQYCEIAAKRLAQEVLPFDA